MDTPCSESEASTLEEFLSEATAKVIEPQSQRLRLQIHVNRNNAAFTTMPFHAARLKMLLTLFLQRRAKCQRLLMGNPGSGDEN